MRCDLVRSETAGINKMAGILSFIIHELSHESWFTGTDDLAYGEDDADALPTNQATNNADSYQYYAEDQ